MPCHAGTHPVSLWTEFVIQRCLRLRQKADQKKEREAVAGWWRCRDGEGSERHF